MGFQKEWVGVFGDPVDDNPTVVLEQAGFDYLNLPFQYLTIQVKDGDLKAAIDGMRAMNFSGINLTMPHKLEVMDYLDEISDAANVIGAVNTVYRKGDKLCGDNTDGKGFLTGLVKADIDPHGKRIVLLGAGGAARAISVELAGAGAAHIAIVNRTEARGRELADLINTKTPAAADFITWTNDFQIPDDTDILVNCTPVGFEREAEKPEIRYDSLKASTIVCDVLPNRFQTSFLREAEKHGCRTLSGMPMLVYQGGIAFELWTGKKAPVDVMLTALKNYYGITD